MSGYTRLEYETGEIMKDDIERYQELTKTLKQLDESKIRLEEQLRSKKQALTELVKKVQAAGYDPSKLKTIVEEKKAIFKKSLDKFEEDLNTARKKLSSIESI